MATRTDGSGTSRILTLVFTDLADSTALKTRRGDQAVGELITRHRAHVQRLAAESGGRIIDWAGEKFRSECGASFVARQKPVLSNVAGAKVESSQPRSLTLRLRLQSKSALEGGHKQDGK